MTDTNKRLPLMPKATAVWLIDNTTLTFAQIADFCGVHELEIKGIADGEVAIGINGIDPIAGGQLTREEIVRCESNPGTRLQLKHSPAFEILARATKKTKTKYTPIARRQDKPDAVFWVLKNCPAAQDSDITKLLGTTKSTVIAIREGTHWNMQNIRPRDPVLLGICSQIDLDKLLMKYRNVNPII